MKIVKIIIIIFLVIILAIGNLSLCLQENEENTERNNETLINEDDSFSQNNNDNQNVDVNSTKNVAIVGMRNLNFSANTKKANVSFKNPIENEGLYYQVFELRLLNTSETGYEVLYKSDLVRPGDEITEIEISKALDKGEYDAILYVQPYKMNEEKTPTNDAKIKVKIIVE